MNLRELPDQNLDAMIRELASRTKRYQSELAMARRERKRRARNARRVVVTIQEGA